MLRLDTAEPPRGNSGSARHELSRGSDPSRLVLTETPGLVTIHSPTGRDFFFKLEIKVNKKFKNKEEVKPRRDGCWYPGDLDRTRPGWRGEGTRGVTPQCPPPHVWGPLPAGGRPATSPGTCPSPAWVQLIAVPLPGAGRGRSEPTRRGPHPRGGWEGQRHPDTVVTPRG